MSRKTVNTVTRRVPHPILAVEKIGENDGLTSPTSPLDLNICSPRKWKDADSQRVGLGIVAELEKSSKFRLQFGEECSDPKRPVAALVHHAVDWSKENLESLKRASYREPKCSVVRIYYEGLGDRMCNTTEFNIAAEDNEIRPERVVKFSPKIHAVDNSKFPAPDFLSACNLCNKKLQGKDIYMYRGEKAFCSEECRKHQIAIDEWSEKCRSGASQTSDSSVSASAGTGFCFPSFVTA